MENRFFEFIGKNYNKLKNECRVKIRRIGLAFNEDVFSDTIIKCNDKLKGNDKIDGKDMVSYFWIAFKKNTLREIGYLRNNTTDEIPDIYDEDGCDEFIDLYDEIATYIIDNFGEELFQLFSLHSNGVLYKELYKMTTITDLK